MPTLNIPRTRQLLEAFDFSTLFIEELNWSRPAARKADTLMHDGQQYVSRHIAELAGVVVLEVAGEGGKMPDAPTRDALHREISKHYHENLLIFLDKPNQGTEEKTEDRDAQSAIENRKSKIENSSTQSLWRWIKREGSKTYPREHLYVKGQPGDLFISKISGMVFDISSFDALGRVSLVRVADALRNALDVERVTKKFYAEYAAERVAFTGLIQGISDERKRRWYASVLLNRLMFIYFLQRKMLVDGGERDYLQKKLAQVTAQFGTNRYYADFLRPLFFQGFARPETERGANVKPLLGAIPYLNGGLFLEHQIEEEYGNAIQVPDAAFANLFGLFQRYSWNLDDTPEGRPDEINPDVLGYIFEKYINQKEFGAYYTRPEITEYLCEHTIHQRILDGVNSYAVDVPGLKPARRYETLPELLLDLDGENCRRLLYDVLPHLRLLDPACGSGAFLVAAMKTLVNVYSAVTGRIEYLTDPSLNRWLTDTRRDHRSLNYHIKRKIITENLYGVDIMEEAADIARLRLFLALVSSVKQGAIEELEPLPNIDFNILPGNALVGLLHVNPDEYNGRLQFTRPYAEVVAEKNRLIAQYRSYSEKKAYEANMQSLRDDIQQRMAQAGETLDELLLDDFQELKINFEQAVWDVDKGKEGKAGKRALSLQDMRDLKPFHWGYQFDEVLDRGGFDVIITNPPWEIFKPQAKEFLTEYADGITKNKMTIKEFEAKQTEALKDDHTRTEWEAYLSRFPHVSQFYRSAPQYVNQIAIVNGKKAGTDINLYKLFVEQCYNLLRKGGQCGIVLPSGIYTDLGAKQLRELLFGCTQITGLFGFENRKMIFENVDSRFKFVVLTFGRGGSTTVFPAAFMRHETSELREFPRRGSLPTSVDLIRRLSPDALSITEFRSEQDVKIAEKMLRFPNLGEWNNGEPLQFSREFMSSDDHGRFNYDCDGLIVYEGKMFEQFDHKFDNPQWWMSLQELKKTHFYERGDWKHYRFAIRRIASNTNNRTLIATVLPRNVVVVHSVFVNVKDILPPRQTLYLVAVLNSFILDYAIRGQVTSNVSQFFVYQLPVPRLTEKDAAFGPIVARAARLICTTPEFDDLAREVGLKSHAEGVTNPVQRARLRAELDGLIAHLYGLTEAEFAHILSTFPLVAEPIKVATQNAYRDVARGLIK